MLTPEQHINYPLSSEAQRQFLENTAILSHITGLQRYLLAACLTIKSYGGGKSIFDEGQPGDCLYIIQKGEVLIFKARDEPATVAGEAEKKTHLTILGFGKIFGEMACLDKSNPLRFAAAQAIKPTTVFTLDVRIFDLIQAEFPILALNLLLFDLINRVRENDAHIEVLASMHRPQRVARFLLDMANQRGEPAADGFICFDLSMPQKVVARLLNITEVALSHQLGQLEDANIIRRKKSDTNGKNRIHTPKPRQLISILDLNALKARAHEPSR